MSDYHIKTDSLRKEYKGFFGKGKVAVHGLTLEVPAGSVFGFIGKNGAGKTSTIRMLLGLSSKTSGKAWLMGKEIGDPEARSNISYMPELPMLDENSSAVKLLTLVGKVSGMKDDEIRDRVPVVLEEVGLAGQENTRFKNFSKGMKQRVELAQAVLTKPKLLILDEPFSGLDPVGRKEVRDLILKYNKEHNTTVFFSSHILNDVETMCDSIAILDKGELKAIGDIDRLLEEQAVEICGEDVDEKGWMFLEKMGTHTKKKENVSSVFLEAGQNPDKVKSLFEKYQAKNIKVIRHHKSLEEYYLETIGEEKSSEEDQQEEAVS